jgi:EAL domain-containing protein (putative c-di-GMP-specific phosphodiesterase class I)/GGDEF domain-containing protein/DNA-binding NarL/FixJ family response regulator
VNLYGNRKGDEPGDDQRDAVFALPLEQPQVGPSNVVLVVAGDPRTRQSLAAVLAGAGVEAVGTDTALEALNMQQYARARVAVVEHSLPDLEGTVLARRLKENDPDAVVLLLTEPASLDAAMAAAAPIDNYLVKPLASGAFVHTVRSAIERQALMAENRALHDRLEHMDVAGPVPMPGTPPPPPVASTRVPVMEDRLYQTLVAVQRDGQRAAVLLVDLQGAAADGNSFWNLAGPAFLSEIEERLSFVRRKTDTVTRLDGGRFVVVCTQVDSPVDADRVAGSVVGELTRPVTVGGVEHRLSPRVGVLLTDDEVRPPEVLLEHAELALRCAKEEGRPWHLFDDAVEESIHIRDRLRSAITKGELHLDYQPVVDLLTFETVGAEALVRLHRPDEEPLEAAAFLAQAYTAGLARPLGRWVLDRALAELSSWRVLEQIPDRFRMWVNVSAEELAEREFADVVEKLTREHGVPTAMVSLEVPEAALSDVMAARHALGGLGELDVALVVDDFGVGRSDLRCLRDLHVTGMKIAPELVASLDADDGGRAAGLVRGLIALGREMRLTVVGEGVETQAQAMALRAMGCDLAQGYYFGRPGPAEGLWARAGLAGE